MEKLEKKIEQIVNKSFKGEYGNSELDEKECSTSIAQEVKDIAIAFAKWYGNLQTSEEFFDKTDEELFNDFIQTYYSPTPEV